MERAAETRRPGARLPPGLDAKIKRGETGAHRRGQEGEPVARADPRRFRSARDRPRLCAGGAACLSVLTDRPSFQGAPEHLAAVRNATALPVLRKDFLFETYQVAESRALGADCILIILAAVDRRHGARALCRGRGLAHGCAGRGARPDRARPRAEARRRFIGINNRNLRTFETTLETTERLAPKVPKDRLLVGESGIATAADVTRLAAAGVKAVLVGESLMRQNDVMAATAALLGRGKKAKSA